MLKIYFGITTGLLSNKWHLSLILKSKNLKFLFATSWYRSCQGKHNAVKYWMTQHFTHIEKEREQGQL